MFGFRFEAAAGGLFSVDRVMSSVRDGARRALQRFGAHVRTAARSSIRKRKKISEPGSPPSSHTGSLKNLIFFGYDPEQQSVVIGPTPFEGRGAGATLLEQGGETIRPAGRRRRARKLHYRPRPFMAPAFEQERRLQLPDVWRDAIRP